MAELKELTWWSWAGQLLHKHWFYCKLSCFYSNLSKDTRAYDSEISHLLIQTLHPPPPPPFPTFIRLSIELGIEDVAKTGCANTNTYYPKLSTSIYKSYSKSFSCQQIKYLNTSSDFLICQQDWHVLALPIISMSQGCLGINWDGLCKKAH